MNSRDEFLAWLEASEKKAQLLNVEVQSLRQEKNNIKSNLEKAEIEGQLLDEENKELRLLLRGKYQGSDGCVISPLQTKIVHFRHLDKRKEDDFCLKLGKNVDVGDFQRNHVFYGLLDRLPNRLRV